MNIFLRFVFLASKSQTISWLTDFYPNWLVGFGIICIDSSPWSMFFFLYFAWYHVKAWCSLTELALCGGLCSLSETVICGRVGYMTTGICVLHPQKRVLESGFPPGIFPSLTLHPETASRTALANGRWVEAPSVLSGPKRTNRCAFSTLFLLTQSECRYMGSWGWQAGMKGA